jgi:hypothetical protein
MHAKTRQQTPYTREDVVVAGGARAKDKLEATVGNTRTHTPIRSEITSTASKESTATVETDPSKGFCKQAHTTHCELSTPSSRSVVPIWACA